MRETIKFTVEGIGEFEVYKTKTCGDEFKIENAAAEMCGGGVELVKFKIEVANQYEKIQSQVKKDVNSNLMDLAFLMDLNENMNLIYSYAILSVVIVKTPEGISKKLNEWTKEQLKQVYSAYEVALEPFSVVNKSTLNETANQGVQHP